jgi:uncharacterized protein involved in tolerance to divalent cations
MILLKISSKDEQIIIKTAETLIKGQFALDINISSNEKRFALSNSEIKVTPIFILTAKTKALLFSKIINHLKEIFGENLPEIFSLPITTMEIEQAENVIKNTLKV